VRVSQSRTACRLIAETDLPAVETLLREGFPDREPGYWSRALDVLRTRAAPDGYPRFGYLLQSADEIVGVILVIFTDMQEGGERWLRANVSSWYVRPDFRSYAPMLTSAALRFKEATYLNISPAEGTWPILDAQGYRRFSQGQMACLPALSLRFGARVRRLDDADIPKLDATEARLLNECAAQGALALVCERGGVLTPFVFVERDLKHVGRGAMQLAWCRDTADFVHFAGPLGRYLLDRGYWLVLLDAEGRVPGLVGRFFRNRMPKYFRGPRRPRLNDLAHTEALLFGV
jgi:hypothetical protein